MTNMTTLHAYKMYLAQTYILKKAEEAGVELGHMFDVREPSSKSYSERFEKILSGEADPLYIGGIYGAPLTTYLSEAFSSGEGLQERREADILALLKVMPSAKVLRDKGDSFIFGKHGSIEWVIRCGQALCVQVLVGHTVTEVPDPELLAVAKAKLEEATAEIPLVKQSVPKYEWRCNDAELFPNA